MTIDTLFLPPTLFLSPLDFKTLFKTSIHTLVFDQNGFFFPQVTVSLGFAGQSDQVNLVVSSQMKIMLIHDQHPFETKRLAINGPDGSIERQVDIIPFSHPLVFRHELNVNIQFLSLKAGQTELIVHAPVCLDGLSKTTLVAIPHSLKEMLNEHLIATLQLQKHSTSLTVIEFDRLITENDVRRAILQKKKIRLTNASRVTPAARDIGREQNIFLN